MATTGKRVFPPSWYAAQAARRKNGGASKPTAPSSTKMEKPKATPTKRVRAVMISKDSANGTSISMWRQGKGKNAGPSTNREYSTVGKRKISEASVGRLNRVLAARLKNDTVRGGRTSVVGVKQAGGTFSKTVNKSYVTPVAKKAFAEKTKRPVSRFGNFK